jgi:L-lysine exporter family protein LysE/ArgO
MPTVLIAGFFTGAALIIAIGAQNAFVLRQGIRQEHVLPIVLVCTLSDLILISAGVAGLGAIIGAAPRLLVLAKLAGAVFLAVYGVAAARRALAANSLRAASGGSISLRAALGMCLGFTLLNPHVYLDTVVLIGSLASQHGEVGRWVFGAGAAAASVVWFFSLGYGARFLAPLFARPGAWRVLDSLIALTMFLLAGGLLAAGQ